MESDITINPANLIGKLHEAAINEVMKKWSDKVEIYNTAIDISDKKDPTAVVKDGEYKIIYKILDKSIIQSEDSAKAPIITYIRFFAGNDVANELLKNEDLNKSISEIVAKKDELTSDYKVPIIITYNTRLQSGKEQSEKEIKKQQSSQTQDAVKRSSKTSSDVNTSIVNALAQTANVKESNPVVIAGKDSSKMKNENFAKQTIDSIAELSENSKEMTPEKMILIMKALENFSNTWKENDIDLDEESVKKEKEETQLNEAETKSKTAQQIYDKYRNYFNTALTGIRNATERKRFKAIDVFRRLSKEKGAYAKLFKWDTKMPRQFARDVFYWADNATKKANESFKTYFVKKTSADKKVDKDAKEQKAKGRLNLKELKDKVEKLTTFISKNGKEIPINEKEKFIVNFNREIEKRNNNIEKQNKKTEKYNVKRKKASDYIPPMPLLKKSLTKKELLSNAGPKTLRQFLELSKGNLIINGEVKPIPKTISNDNYKEIQSLCSEYPQELYAWFPEEFSNVITKTIQTQTETEVKKILTDNEKEIVNNLEKQIQKLRNAPTKNKEEITYIKELIDKLKNSDDITLDDLSVEQQIEALSAFLKELQEEQSTASDEKYDEIIRLSALIHEITDKKEKLTLTDIHKINDTAIDVGYFHGKVNESASCFVFNSKLLLDGKIRLNNKLLNEHKQKMVKQSEKLIKQIVSNKNVTAQKTLESIIRNKIMQRIKNVLEETNS